MSRTKNNNKTMTQMIKDLKLIEVEPRTENQKKMVDSFYDDILTLVHGYPGTGKTYLSLWLMFNEMYVKGNPFNKVVIIRSSVSSREIGFQPGKTQEKMAEYEAPYENITNELFNRGDAYRVLKQKGIIEFTSSSFLRGVTFNDCLVLVDEFQNMSWNELHTIITRMGENCKMVIIGDTGQDDLTSERFKEESGAHGMMKILRKMSEEDVGFIRMEADDILRSGFVKRYILTMYDK